MQPAATVLVVDDTADVREVIARTLEDAGFVVLKAATGTQALEIARRGVDLVVLDIHLPDIDGWEVCRRLKADPETASILVLHLSGAYRTPEDRTRGLDAGADGYLVQPVDLEELVATCRAMLRTGRGGNGPNLREMIALAAVVAATSGPLEMPETMRRVARATTRVVSADSAVFWIVDEANETAMPGAGYHVPKPLLADIRPYRFSEIPSVILDAFRGRRIVAIADVADDPRFDASAIRASAARSVVAVPVFLKNRVFGCLVLFWWTATHTVTAGELSLVATIAGQAALALENSRLYEETECERRIARAAEDRYRALFQHTPAALFRTTADGRFLECNEALVRTLRYSSRDEVLALNAAALYADPADRELLLARLRSERLVTAHEMRWRRADGSTFWVAATIRLVGEQAAAHLDGVAIDITDRKHAEEALERYQRLFARSFVGIFRTRPDGICLECNDAFAHILGYADASEVQGRSIVEHYVTRADRDAIVARISAGEEVVDAEFTARRRDGTLVPVAMSVRRVVDPDGAVHEGTLIDMRRFTRRPPSVPPPR